MDKVGTLNATWIYEMEPLRKALIRNILSKLKKGPDEGFDLKEFVPIFQVFYRHEISDGFETVVEYAMNHFKRIKGQDNWKHVDKKLRLILGGAVKQMRASRGQ